MSLVWTPLAAILLGGFGSLVSLMILYWIIRLAVRHGIEDARRRRGPEQPAPGYWDPARTEARRQRRRTQPTGIATACFPYNSAARQQYHATTLRYG